jgi:putative membrane protein
MRPVRKKRGVNMMFNGWCNFGQWGMYGWIGMLVNLVLVIALVLLAVWVVKKLFANTGTLTTGAGAGSAREILDQRYARGEITREQYEQMKADIR